MPPSSKCSKKVRSWSKYSWFAASMPLSAVSSYKTAACHFLQFQIFLVCSMPPSSKCSKNESSWSKYSWFAAWVMPLSAVSSYNTAAPKIVVGLNIPVLLQCLLCLLIIHKNAELGNMFNLLNWETCFKPTSFYHFHNILTIY